MDRVTHGQNTKTQPEANENTSTTPTDKQSYKPSEKGNEYIINSNIRHINKDKDVKYVVRWYRYGPADDTVELPVNICQHYITRYEQKFNRNRKFISLSSKITGEKQNKTKTNKQYNMNTTLWSTTRTAILISRQIHTSSS